MISLPILQTRLHNLFRYSRRILDKANRTYSQRYVQDPAAQYFVFRDQYSMLLAIQSSGIANVAELRLDRAGGSARGRAVWR